MRFAIVSDTPAEAQANGIRMLSATSVRPVSLSKTRTPVFDIIADEEIVAFSHHHHQRT
jgi:hypothetical protein